MSETTKNEASERKLAYSLVVDGDVDGLALRMGELEPSSGNLQNGHTLQRQDHLGSRILAIQQIEEMRAKRGGGEIIRLISCRIALRQELSRCGAARQPISSAK
jgi:hypothetical protein